MAFGSFTHHSISPPPPPTPAPIWHAKLAALQACLKLACEHCASTCGLDAGLLSLLAAAFLASNALSLPILLFVAIAMSAPPCIRVAAWRYSLLPLLACLLALEYCVWVGLVDLLQPLVTLPGGHPPSSHGPAAAWLAPVWSQFWGLRGVESPTLWMLFLSYTLCVMQVGSGHGGL